jgi:hypothetical protein
MLCRAMAALKSMQEMLMCESTPDLGGDDGQSILNSKVDVQVI